MTDAINGVTQFGYDANSDLLTVTDAKTQQTVYTPNNMNRTITRKDPLLNTETTPTTITGTSPRSSIGRVKRRPARMMR